MKPLLLALLLSAPVFADVPPGPPPEAAKHPEGIEKTVGVIEGGWEYVYGAYSVAVLGVTAFALSLFLRRPKTGNAS